MSPRKNNIITISAWPQWRVDRLYKGKVRSVNVEKGSGCLRVTIENLDPAQFSRICEIVLPPAHPGNRTSTFLSACACGIEANTPGTTVRLDQVTGAAIAMRFRGTAANGAEEFDFERIIDSPADVRDSAKKSRGQTERDSA
jgi:hypothetical protein